MNLCDFLRRKDENLKIFPENSMAKLSFSGKRYSGFCVKMVDGKDVFSLKKPLAWFPLREYQTWNQWGISIVNGQSAQGEVLIYAVTNGVRTPVKTMPLVGHDLIFPFRDLSMSRDVEELVVSYEETETPRKMSDLVSLRGLLYRAQQFFGKKHRYNTKLFFACSEVMDRNQLLPYCQGSGVELGPGHNPFLKPSNGFHVKYVEQFHPKKWEELYGSSKFVVKPEEWSHYIIGEAHALPVEDESIDYVFSSHVFEHLYNPIGHVRHWLSKLKSGGRIVAVVPAIEGCKDYKAEACKLDDFLVEDQTNRFEPELWQYERYSRLRSMKDSGADLMAKKRSIHVHFYSEKNILELMQWLKNNLEIAQFELIYKMNNKDFYFIIEKK